MESALCNERKSSNDFNSRGEEGACERERGKGGGRENACGFLQKAVGYYQIFRVVLYGVHTNARKIM